MAPNRARRDLQGLYISVAMELRVQEGVSQNYGYHFGGPYSKDYSILGSILGYLNFGKLPGVGAQDAEVVGTRKSDHKENLLQSLINYDRIPCSRCFAMYLHNPALNLKILNPKT